MTSVDWRVSRCTILYFKQLLLYNNTRWWYFGVVGNIRLMNENVHLGLAPSVIFVEEIFLLSVAKMIFKHIIPAVLYRCIFIPPSRNSSWANIWIIIIFMSWVPVPQVAARIHWNFMRIYVIELIINSYRVLSNTVLWESGKTRGWTHDVIRTHWPKNPKRKI